MTTRRPVFSNTGTQATALANYTLARNGSAKTGLANDPVCLIHTPVTNTHLTPAGLSEGPSLTRDMPEGPARQLGGPQRFAEATGI